MSFIPIVIRALAFAVRMLLKAVSFLRLGLPLLYCFTVSFFLRGWIARNPRLSMGILYALLGYTALSWAAALVRKLARGRETDG